MTIAQMEKLLLADQVETRIKELTEAHRADFTNSQRLNAGRSTVPTVEALARIIYSAVAREVSLFSFSSRRTLKAEAFRQAEVEKKRLEKLENQKQAKAQKILDAEWEWLLSNDPETLIPLLAEAFGNNEATCAPLSINGSTLAILMLVPSADLLPTKKVGESPTGQLSLRQMKATERREIYFDLVFSQAVASVREAFAVAPGVEAIDFVLVRNESHAKVGGGPLACIGFGQIGREQIEAESLLNEPYRILSNCASRWVSNISASLDLRVVDLKGEPEIRALLELVNDGGM